jgi:O-Antigen ligase
LNTSQPSLTSPLKLAGAGLEKYQNSFVWLMFAATFVTIIEPAPSDLLFVVALCSFYRSGLNISAAIAPLIAFLLLYNVGGFLSYLQIADDDKAQMFVITSTYMAIMAVFVAFYISMDTLQRFELIKRALTIAAVIASIIGLIGYMRIGGFRGGSPDFQSEVAAYSRAVGLFKDPNVFSTYLIFPALMLVQGFMLGTQHHKVVSGICLIIILAALFLAFSRGAWISFSFSFLMMVGFTFVLAPSNAMRSRIIFFTVLGLVVVAVLMAILLSIEQVRNLFLDRFTLVKSYDAGETGRFGNQLNSIRLLMDRPLGFGPFQFRNIFGIDPHNVYINSFGSYGWLGGISYLVMIVTTLFVGLRSLVMRTPWQNFAIVVYCPMVTTIFQGVQIDTDHWRHFYWLLGLTWGLFAAGLAYRASIIEGHTERSPEHRYT